MPALITVQESMGLTTWYNSISVSVNKSCLVYNVASMFCAAFNCSCRVITGCTNCTSQSLTQ